MNASTRASTNQTVESVEIIDANFFFALFNPLPDDNFRLFQTERVCRR